MTESKKIHKAFTRLRDFDVIVMNFNSNKANNPGIEGHLDWELYTKKHAIYIETKIGKDKLRPKQIEVINRLAHLMGLPNSRIYVASVKTGADAEKIATRILSGEL